jgi:hypothetical protein
MDSMDSMDFTRGGCREMNQINPRSLAMPVEFLDASAADW